MRTIDYLDAIKARHGLRTDYQLSKFTGWNKQRVSNYRNGKTELDEAACIQVAEWLDENPAKVMAEIQASRTKCPEAAQIWAKVAKAMQGVSLSAFVAFSVAAPIVADAATTAHYILCKTRRTLRIPAADYLRRWVTYIFPATEPSANDSGADNNFSALAV